MILKKIFAVALFAGLCLPYTCDVVPITDVWSDVAGAIGLGLPIVVGVAYVLHTLLPPLARFHERNGPALHGLFRMVFFILAGFYMADAVRDTTNTSDQLAYAGALLVTGGLLYWEQERGTKAQRLPLLLLIVFGIPVLTYLLTSLGDDLQIGAWLVTGGYLGAVALEVRDLARVEKITHGG